MRFLSLLQSSAELPSRSKAAIGSRKHPIHKQSNQSILSLGTVPLFRWCAPTRRRALLKRNTAADSNRIKRESPPLAAMLRSPSCLHQLQHRGRPWFSRRYVVTRRCRCKEVKLSRRSSERPWVPRTPLGRRRIDFLNGFMGVQLHLRPLIWQGWSLI